MKLSKLLAYGIGGIIAGLIIENSVLRLRQKGEKGLRSFEDQAGKKLKKLNKMVHHQS